MQSGASAKTSHESSSDSALSPPISQDQSNHGLAGALFRCHTSASRFGTGIVGQLLVIFATLDDLKLHTESYGGRTNEPMLDEFQGAGPKVSLCRSTVQFSSSDPDPASYLLASVGEAGRSTSHVNDWANGTDCMTSA